MAAEKYSGYYLKIMLISGTRTLSQSKTRIDALNVFPVPDGDTGTNMDLTLQSACEEVNKAKSNDLAEIVQAFSYGSLMGARGNSGVILSQLLRGFSRTLQEKKEFDVFDFTKALGTGVNTAYKAVLTPVEGTILTVAKDAALNAKNYLKMKDNPTLMEMLEEVVKGARESLDKTPEKLSVLKESGVVDAGGMGLVVFYEGMMEGFKKSLSVEDKNLIENFEAGNNGKVSGLSDLKEVERKEVAAYKYCTEILIKGSNLDENGLKEKLGFLGDSMLVAGTLDILKVHIHTNRPGIVIDECSKIGELSDVKVDNMSEQHQEVIEKNTGYNNNNKADNTNGIGLVAVVSGEGLEEIFESMGVDKVISGGQSMNPSTRDLLKGVEEVEKEKIILLPNNKNIIMTCKQVVNLTEKNVEVVETKTIPEGISALLEFTPNSQEIATEKKKMENICKEVCTGEVTYAVRDTEINEMEVEKGDYIGIVEGEIVFAGKELEEIAYQTVHNMIEEDMEVISIFSGEKVSEKDCKYLMKKISRDFENMEIELYFGGQPLYYYIFSAE